ncbi:MAG: hypothetical protein KKE17_02880 [Proteobacteria bacterium]|nr:hypothetical protein [Pseudomonadota bacterium]MBU1708926.1 hypothetical protein [Pseudomonadota bacterium]
MFKIKMFRKKSIQVGYYKTALHFQIITDASVHPFVFAAKLSKRYENALVGRLSVKEKVIHYLGVK